MLTFYTVCAVIGGVILIVQFLLSLVGLGDHSGLGDGGHGCDFHGPHTGDAHGHTDAHDSSWFFRLVSFRSVIAALAFLGLGGGLGTSLGLSAYSAFMLALSTGLLAMVSVAWIFHLLINLRAEGTLRIGEAIGQPGVVYLSIPAHRAGVGKVTVTVQERSLEFEALTDAESTLSTGTPVIVTGVVNDHTLEVVREKE